MLGSIDVSCENVSVETVSRETIDPWWVTGFVETAGSFTYSRSGKQLALYFGLKLASTERPLLEQVRRFLGEIGKIYIVKGPRPSHYLRVSHRADLPAVLDHFDHYPLQTSKRATYEIWREMVLLKQQFRRVDREALERLARDLSKHAD